MPAEKDPHDQKEKKRIYENEFKADAVRLVKQGNKSSFQIAKHLDLTPSELHNWAVQAEVDAGKGSEGALSTNEKEELERLRKENNQLMMECEILKKSDGLLCQGVAQK